MPNRIVAFSCHSVGRGRVSQHCSVDGTTPCRGADLSHRRRNRIGRDTIQGMKCSVESIADITRWSSERNADRLEAPRQRKLFGIQVATTQCVPSLIGMRGMRKVVNELAESSSELFAVIESRWTDRRSDRFVLAYRDEESLRALIATPSIIAVGFTSREDAIKRIEACFSAATPWHEIQKATPGDGAGCDQHRSHSAAQRVTRRFSFAPRGTVRRVLQHAVAAAILVFYSRNIMGTLMRAFVGA